MPTVDTRHSIVIVKSFAYRGGTQRWSNRYHFTVTTVPTLAEWEVLADAIVNAEKEMTIGAVTIVEAIGYDVASATPTNPHGLAVFSKTYAVTGNMTTLSNIRAPGDAAATIRYSTDARSIKNHPIYLFNYYHGVLWAVGETPDTLAANEHTAMQTYGDAWLAGFSDGSNTRVRCGPRGAVAQQRFVNPLITHRDFPH